MAELCREFGIFRKTGYKIFDRYQECGMQGLTRKSLWPKSVTYVLGTLCHPCLRAGPPDCLAEEPVMSELLSRPSTGNITRKTPLARELLAYNCAKLSVLAVVIRNATF